MNTFSFLWSLLVIILTISNMYLILKYFLDRFLLKKNPKLELPLMQWLVISIYIFSNIIISFSNNFSFHELIKILHFYRIETFIGVAFLFSSLFIILFHNIVYANANIISKNLYFYVFCAFMGLFFHNIMKGILTIFFEKTTPYLSTLPFEREIFFIYRAMVFPIIYLISVLLFWLISKKKIYYKNSYNKKMKLVIVFKSLSLYLYLVYIFGMIYLKLKYSDFYFNELNSLLVEIIFTSIACILLYIAIPYSIINENNKKNIFGDLFKKIYFWGSCIPFLFVLVFATYYKLQKLSINPIVIIITAVLAAVTTFFINFFISRFFNSKQQ